MIVKIIVMVIIIVVTTAIDLFIVDKVAIAVLLLFPVLSIFIE